MTTDALTSRIAERLAAIRQRMARAAERSGRQPAAVRLVAVSKTFGPEYIRAAHAAGQVDFGENRVQEALGKQAETADLSLRWHLIGPLQSNKTRKAVGPFACIHSVDRLDLLDRLEAVGQDAGAHTRVLIQVDLAHEATKAGADVEDVRRLLARARECRAVAVDGLMLLPPLADDPEDARPWFRQLRELRDTLIDEGVPSEQLTELSMGMSHDFEVAVEEGATIVRIGSAIFGNR